jgi:hypothetical protein
MAKNHDRSIDIITFMSCQKNQFSLSHNAQIISIPGRLLALRVSMGTGRDGRAWDKTGRDGINLIEMDLDEMRWT